MVGILITVEDKPRSLYKSNSNITIISNNSPKWAK